MKAAPSPQRSTCPTLGFGNPACHDTATPAFRASKALYESHYRGILGYAELNQIPIAQKAFDGTQAPYLHDKLNGLHDQSSSASRVTAGAATKFSRRQFFLGPQNSAQRRYLGPA